MTNRDDVQPRQARATEACVRAQIPMGEHIVWCGGPSVRYAVERQARSGWQTTAILVGGYSVLLGIAAAWLTAHAVWLTVPAICLVVCVFGLRSELQRSTRLAARLERTTYVLTTRHAIVVDHDSDIRVIALSDVEPALRSSANRVSSDLVFRHAEDVSSLLFADLNDASVVLELVHKLKAAPEAMEQQVAVMARWAELRDGFS